MSELEKQVRRVGRRLNFQQFLHILIWCWVAALLCNLAWVTVEKLWRPMVDPWWLSAVASLSFGALVAGGIWFFRRRGSVDAALALDQAFNLKERVSTTMTLGAEQRQSQAGLALVSDTLKRIEAIDVHEKFRIEVPRTAWLPLVSATLVYVVATFLNLSKTEPVEAKTESTAAQKQVKESTKVLAQRLEKQAEQAKQQGMEEAEKLLAEITKKTGDDLQNSKEMDQKKALAKVNNLQDAIKDRREKVASAETMQRQLEKLKSITEKGPADKMHEALKAGDFKKAAEEVSKLAEALKSGKLDDAQKKALEKQLQQMKENLQKAANLEERKKQLEQSGLPPDVLKQEMAKLEAQAKQLEKLQDLADKLGKAQEALSKQDLEKALEQLDMSKGDLAKMMKELQEMEMLDKVLDNMADMKNAMVCKNCGGKGCPACQGTNGRGYQNGATGSRDEEEDDTRTFQTRVRQKIRPGGKVEVTGFVPGKQMKGESQLEIQASLEAGAAAATDAVSKQNIPREHRKQAKEYFEAVGQSK